MIDVMIVIGDKIISNFIPGVTRFAMDFRRLLNCNQYKLNSHGRRALTSTSLPFITPLHKKEKRCIFKTMMIAGSGIGNTMRGHQSQLVSLEQAAVLVFSKHTKCF